jgi:hypothetical protein
LSLGQFIEFVEFGLEQLLIGHSGLVLGDQSGRHRPAQSIFNDLVILGRTKQYANRWLLMRLLHVAVESLKIELEFAKVFRLELDDFEFERDQAVECAIEKASSAESVGDFRLW